MSAGTSVQVLEDLLDDPRVAPVIQRVFWCTFEGLVAIALLLGGGLGSLQAAAISTGLPFAIVLVGMCWAIWVGLRKEPR